MNAKLREELKKQITHIEEDVIKEFEICQSCGNDYEFLMISESAKWLCSSCYYNTLAN